MSWYYLVKIDTQRIWAISKEPWQEVPPGSEQHHSIEWPIPPQVKQPTLDELPWDEPARHQQVRSKQFRARSMAYMLKL